MARAEFKELRSQAGLYLFVPLILAQILGTAFLDTGAFDTPILSTSGLLAVQMANTLTLTICLLMLFYTVESFERESRNGFDSIFHSTPIRTASSFLGKGLANGVVAGVILLAALVVYLIRRPRPAPPPRPAHEIAMEALRALAAKDLIGKGQFEPFFVEITWIVRDYIELAFGLRAPEQTTEEFLGNIGSAPAVARHRDILEPFLTAADEVKFARATPETSTIQRAFEVLDGYLSL